MAWNVDQWSEVSADILKFRSQLGLDKNVGSALSAFRECAAHSALHPGSHLSMLHRSSHRSLPPSQPPSITASHHQQPLHHCSLHPSAAFSHHSLPPSAASIHEYSCGLAGYDVVLYFEPLPPTSKTSSQPTKHQLNRPGLKLNGCAAQEPKEHQLKSAETNGLAASSSLHGVCVVNMCWAGYIPKGNYT